MILNNRAKGDRLLMGVAFKHNFAQNQKLLASHHVFSHEKIVITQFQSNR